MSQSEQGKNGILLRFGEFTLNLERRGLYRGPARVHLTSKPLETLIFLVENRTRTVEKQEFFDAIWKDTFVTEDNLVHAIREIRRVLKDNKEDPHYIQTVPRHGYRFVAEVTTDEPVSNFSQLEEKIATPPSVVAPVRTKLRWVWLAAPILALISILAWFLLTRDGHSHANPVADELRSGGIKNQITTGEFSSGKPAFSPDGKFILYVSSDEDTRGNGDLFIRQFPEGNAQRIANKINPSGDLPVFTADGSHVVFSLPRIAPDYARHHDLWIVPSFGGHPTRFIEDASGAGFSPDQKLVAYTKYLPSGNALWVSPVIDLTRHYEVSTPGYTPRWSPNGEWLAYSTADPNEGEGNLRMCRVSSDNGAFVVSNHAQLTRESESIYGLTWTANSREIIFASKRSGAAQLYKVSVTDGQITSLLTGVGQYIAPSASSDATSVVFQYFRLTNDLMTSSTEAHSTGTNNEAKNITFDEFHSWPRISPSGEKLASVVKRVDNAERLYITDLKTREASQVSDRNARHPCWLNDVEIAFLSQDASSDNTEVLVVNTATRESRSLTTLHGRADWLAIHPGGKKLAVVLKGPDHMERIVLRNLVEQTDSTIHQGAEYEDLRWSPDGSALSWDRPGPSINAPLISGGIWMIPVGQSEPQLLIKEGYCPVWSGDGTAIYFSSRHERQGLWRYDLTKRTRQLVLSWDMVFSYDLVGHRLVYAQHKNNSQVYLLSLRP
jgi:Tol biopolymer transport system component/DNA-binding winged helix-turn-helix (wHTH) protein